MILSRTWNCWSPSLIIIFKSLSLSWYHWIPWWLITRTQVESILVFWRSLSIVLTWPREVLGWIIKHGSVGGHWAEGVFRWSRLDCLWLWSVCSRTRYAPLSWWILLNIYLYMLQLYKWSRWYPIELISRDTEWKGLDHPWVREVISLGAWRNWLSYHVLKSWTIAYARWSLRFWAW